MNAVKGNSEKTLKIKTQMTKRLRGHESYFILNSRNMSVTKFAY